MASANHVYTRILRFGLIILLLLSGVSVMPGQTKQLLTWQENLIYLQNIPDSDLEEQQDLVGKIRTGLEFWLQLHPKSDVALPAAPSQPLSAEQIKSEISLLLETVEKLLKQDSLRPFELGVTEITVTSELSPLSPVADSIENAKIENSHATNAVEALQLLPGITLDYKPSRSQTGVMIRGFDTRQIGLYLDNIPIYVPYDGYADIGRFLTRNVAEIQVAKGYSSPLLGPNGLGGAVNIVTRQPEKKFQGDFVMGSGSGRMIESGFHAGSRLDRFILQGGIDWLVTDYYPVPGDFNTENDYYGTQASYNRTNSYQRDADYDGRIGFLPNERDQYIFSFMGQNAEYGATPYSGNDPDNESPKYWQWDYWERESYYFNGSKGLDEKSDLRFRAFFDRYPNRMNVFLEPDTEEGIEPYSELESYSKYNDYSAGFSSDFSTRALNRHDISASFFYKNDTHQESDVEYDDGEAIAIPGRTHRDQQISIGLQDSIDLTSRIRAVLGFSAENINSLKAQDLVDDEVAPFECSNDSFSGCLDAWAFNPLASVSFSVSESGTLFATFAKKSHFPTMKDRYSYKNNKAIPNPTLEPEHSRNWSIGYSHVFPFRTMFQVELFRSDVYDAIEKGYIPDPEELCKKSDRKGYCQQSFNVGDAVNQGVEFTVRSNPHSRLTIDLNYTYLNRNISLSDDVPPVYPTDTPKHKIVGTASVELPHDFMLLATARLESGTIGNFYTDEMDEEDPEDDLLIPIPGSNFATADLGGIFRLFGGPKLQVGVKNIFDRYYYYREGYPMAGRSWYCNMKYQF
ncbi:MAG: TonB-dependent receptor [Acidobacteria bacterium]|nr:TonB-dependent receptor [Acidobacteriota bacterium]